MKRSLIILAALLGLSCSTWAGQPGNNGNGQGGCGQGQQTNGCGGAGGSGGNASTAAIAGAVSGSVSGVSGSGNSSSSSNAAGGAGGSASAAGGQSQAVGTVTVNGDSYEAARIPVATAYAAPLAVSNGTCFGSASGGIQAPGWGVSLGSTVFDSDCDRRYDANVLVSTGNTEEARELMRQKPSVEAAFKRVADRKAGRAEPTKTRAEAILDGEPAAQVAYTDPIVRARLGLPPLK